MKLFFIKSATQIKYAYPAETIAEISDESTADMFIRRGFAVPAPEKFTPLPPDLPFRDKFIESGIISWQQIKALPFGHSLSDQSVYGFHYPKTSKMLKDYEEMKAKKAPKKDIIY